MKSKQLVLHIGYPKTATTTLQEELFLGLHQRGIINYLGRTVQSTHIPFWRKSIFEDKDWVVDLRKHFFLGEDLDLSGWELSPDKLNVLSDEDFTFHGLFHLARFGEFKNPFEFPAELQKLTSKADEVTLLLTIRNQPALLHSCFVQKYRFIHNHQAGMSFSNFILDEAGHFKKADFEMYDFNLLTEAYITSLQANLKVLLFEDFLYDRLAFEKDLAALLDIDQQLIASLLGEKHHRKRSKKKEGIVTGITKPTALKRMVQRVAGAENMDRYLTRSWYLNGAPKKRLEQLFFQKTIPYTLPHLSEQERKIIQRNYRESNETFFKEQGIDPGKLHQYGYI